MELYTSWNPLPSLNAHKYPQLPPSQSPREAVRLLFHSWGSWFLPHSIVSSEEGSWEMCPILSISFAWSWWLLGKARFLVAHGFSNIVEPMGLGHQEWHRPGSVVRSAEACGKLESTDPTEGDGLCSGPVNNGMWEVIPIFRSFSSRNWRSNCNLKFSNFYLLAQLNKKNETAHLQACSVCPLFCSSLDLKHPINPFPLTGIW